jgi:hypothetical protein
MPEPSSCPRDVPPPATPAGPSLVIGGASPANNLGQSGTMVDRVPWSEQDLIARNLPSVPGNRPERFDMAAASAAHHVILDLEGAVAPEAKTGAALVGPTGRLPLREGEISV